MKGKRFALLGLGKSGQATAAYLLAQGAIVIGLDDRLEELDLSSLRAAGLETRPSKEGLPLVGAVVKSPGIPLHHPLLASYTGPLLSEMEIAARALSTQPIRLIGITGSNGKTTTTLLTTHLLREGGWNAKAFGNIGTPLIELLNEKACSVAVVELSSFQLETLQTPLFEAGVLLNLTPNHLDHHGSFTAYAEAKLRLHALLKADAPLYVDEEVLQVFGDKLVNAKVPPLYLCDRALLAHDRANARMAVALARHFGVGEEAIAAGLASFEKPPHRMEFVCTLKGVHYVNDSKATSRDAVAKAVAALPGPLVLIAGGKDKGDTFADWDFLVPKVREVIALGETAAKFARELAGKIDVTLVKSLEEAVKKAYERAQEGDTVLLSPGCSSYDMFQDYAHRGERFKTLVFELRRENL